MNLEPVIARLLSGGIVAKGLAALVQLRIMPNQVYPAIFVSPDRETAFAPQVQLWVHDQQVSCDFLVVIHLDGNSVKLDDDLQRIPALVEDRLIGWAHPEAEGTATAFKSQQLFEIENGRVALMMKFATTRRIRKNIPAGGLT